MKEYKVDLAFVLKENLYCKNCGAWVYCPEMNKKIKDEQGNEVDFIGDGCLKESPEGDYIECPDCVSRYYLD